MKAKKIFALATMLLVLPLVLAGCGKNSEQNTLPEWAPTFVLNVDYPMTISSYQQQWQSTITGRIINQRSQRITVIVEITLINMHNVGFETFTIQVDSLPNASTSFTATRLVPHTSTPYSFVAKIL